jgi:hypothetical protein
MKSARGRFKNHLDDPQGAPTPANARIVKLLPTVVLQHMPLRPETLWVAAS